MDIEKLKINILDTLLQRNDMGEFEELESINGYLTALSDVMDIISEKES